MGDIMESEDVDHDTVDEATLQQEFNVKCNLVVETAVSNQECYINKMHGNKCGNIALGLSDNRIHIYHTSESALRKLCTLSGHGEHTLTEVVWCPEEEHVLYSCSLDGVVRKWDIRAHDTHVHDYKDDAETMLRPFECMDVSCNGRVLCAGSSLVEEDAYLVFWDRRALKPLGGYWNSHTDDLTQIKFHPTKGETLASGSLDGLVNVYNIAERSEDEALTYSLNVENSVERVCWLSDDRIACVSQSNDTTLWNAATGDNQGTFTRDKICSSIKRSKADDCYVADVYSDVHGQTVMLAGSHTSEGACLRAVTVRGGKVRPMCVMPQGRPQVVRCSWYCAHMDRLLTAGEAGLLALWHIAH